MTAALARPRAADPVVERAVAGDDAAFTVLVVIALSGSVAPRWIGYLGYAAAALIATGVVIPLGLGVASLSNFAGYVAWCLWLIAMAVVLWRRPAVAAASTAAPAHATR